MVHRVRETIPWADLPKMFGWNTPEEDDAESARKAQREREIVTAQTITADTWHTTAIPLDPADDEPVALERCFVCDPAQDVRASRYRMHMAGHGISV